MCKAGTASNELNWWRYQNLKKKAHQKTNDSMRKQEVARTREKVKRIEQKKAETNRK